MNLKKKKKQGKCREKLKLCQTVESTRVQRCTELTNSSFKWEEYKLLAYELLKEDDNIIGHKC